MLFNSYQFVFGFLPVAFIGFFLIARVGHRAAALWLAFASLFFYGWWNPHYLALLLGSIAFNYTMGYAIGRQRARHGESTEGKWLLAFALSINLLLLGYFKYTDFFIGTVNDLAGAMLAFARIILPLGISFFTFTQIAFLVDVYRGIAKEYNPVHYLLFVTYFPHLIAGPILHHKQMMPQFDDNATYRPNVRNINIGLTIFTIGLFKKVMLADQFALYANPVFDGAAAGLHPGIIDSWIAALAYTLQLYFDFSGYSDMAIGLSRLFNIDLPVNFNSPYKAQNIVDFWRRWHMTLSAFLRDYLYIPLGGNRHGTARRYVNLMVTMLLGGLWHGANWTFVLWGLLHGSYLVINHGWDALRAHVALPKLPGSSALAWAITFLAVVIAWVVFRATSFHGAMAVLDGMIGRNAPATPVLASLRASAVPLAWIGAGLAVIKFSPNSLEISAFLQGWKYRGRLAGCALASLLVFVLLNFNKVSTFIYFQF